MPDFTAEDIEAGLAVLETYAKRGIPLTYTQLNLELDSLIDPPKGPYFAGRVGQLCDDINRRHLELNPSCGFLISALVHGVESPRLPGNGFFRLADELNFIPTYTENRDTRRTFVAGQLEAIYAAYRTTT
jgi:hypothetical protein